MNDLFALLALTLVLASVLAANASDAQKITIDGGGPGRVFDGIGGLSAGAASRLLIDYPEPQRSQILDFLFKPHFGAEVQALKVEIGGDVNSTWGSEPSHASSRDEFEHPKPQYYDRGYEWWLMKEARKRNPDVVLEGLQWGAPGWIGGGDYFSQDNADFIAAFIKGARDFHGVTIEYQGIRNEAGYKVDWIKTLRKTLDASGLQAVKLAAADDAGDVEWKIAKDAAADPELSKAIYAFATHYVPYTTTDLAKQSGKPLWDSEAAVYGENWGRAKNLARLYNRNYIIGRMTKTVICTPITSLFDHLIPFGVSIWNNPGLMKANTPWSGYYEVPPSVWVTAHTTQFAPIGWRYVDGGCGLLKEAGSYVTLRDPKSSDYSIVVETMNNLPYDQASQNTNAMDADTEVPVQQVTFSIANLSGGVLHVWRTNKSAQFSRLPDITPKDGSFTITLDGNSVYTLTTTTGQSKGSYRVPKASPFPFPYDEDFEKYEPGKLARYISDQEGAFEVAARSDGQGKCLRQVAPQKPIKWFVNIECPWTIVGDGSWTDYEVAVDVHIEKTGFGGVCGRIDAPLSGPMPGGYILSLDNAGAWSLRETAVILKSGKISGNPAGWHNLKLRFKGKHVIAEIDGRTLCSIEDDFHPRGAVGVISSYDPVEFDNLRVSSFEGPEPKHDARFENLAIGAKVTASAEAGRDRSADKAIDGDHATGWCSGKTADQWLELDFGRNMTFDRVIIDQHKPSPWVPGGDIAGFKIQYWEGDAWKDAASGANMAVRRHTEDFSPVTSSKVRLLVTSCGENGTVWEFQVLNRSGL